MKRFILVICMFLTLGSVIAAERPRWVSLPINVYVPSNYGNMTILMKQAFTTWEKQSNGLVRFKFVPSASNADIEVEFVDFVTNCNSTHAVGCTQQYQRGGQYYKSFVTIGTKEYKYESQGGRPTRTIVTRDKSNIYGVMLHEAGHAIGLDHSPNTQSIMYDTDLKTLQYLTKEDMRLLYNKYH